MQFVVDLYACMTAQGVVLCRMAAHVALIPRPFTNGMLQLEAYAWRSSRACLLPIHGVFARHATNRKSGTSMLSKLDS